MYQLHPRFPGNLKKAVTISYDDGVEQDIRLISLMEQYGIKGTFNLNSGCYAAEGTQYPAGHIHRRLSASQVSSLYRSPNVEVALHALNHPHLEQLPHDLVAYEICADRHNLEQQFEKPIHGMAYPFGTYNDTVVRILGECGISYSRTTKSTHSFDLPKDWLRLNPTCHHKDPELLRLTDTFLAESDSPAPQLLYVWGHSYEFEQQDNWDVIETFFRSVSGHSDIWYATNIEIYNYLAAYAALDFSLDGSYVSNPTAFDIFFATREDSYCVPSGAQIKL